MKNYEKDPDKFAGYFQEPGGVAVAWRVLGWETEPNEDTGWSGIESRTGRVVACMIGDDSLFVFEEDELVPLPRDQFCGGCGQIGCTCDGYDQD